MALEEDTECKLGNNLPISQPNYSNKLMLSEWLVDVPQDLETAWIIKPCPEGKRVLAVSSRGVTELYGRRGDLVRKMNTALPGGNKKCRSTSSMLDCVWSPLDNTLYILDAIYWGCSLLDCQAEFRFYWINCKLAEVEKAGEGIRLTEVAPRQIRVCSEHPLFPDNKPRLDGLLFYHRDGTYLQGVTSPLVTWLKPFMLPRILGIPVHPGYLDEIPPTYLDKMDVSDPDTKTEKPGSAEEEEMCVSVESKLEETAAQPPSESKLELYQVPEKEQVSQSVDNFKAPGPSLVEEEMS